MSYELYQKETIDPIYTKIRIILTQAICDLTEEEIRKRDLLQYGSAKLWDSLSKKQKTHLLYLATCANLVVD